MNKAPVLSSVGGLIIDDIYYPDGRKICNVLGGGGVFAIYGKRTNNSVCVCVCLLINTTVLP
jgi:hypothetical protein